MKDYLFPHSYRRIGWWMITISVLLGVIELIKSGDLLPGKAFAILSSNPFETSSFATIVNTDWTIQIFVIFFSLGLLFIGFSRESVEDEYVAKIRFQALVWSLFVNTILVIITTLFVYGLAYIYVMYFYAFSLLLLFVCRYIYKIYQFNNSNNEE